MGGEAVCNNRFSAVIAPFFHSHWKHSNPGTAHQNPYKKIPSGSPPSRFPPKIPPLLPRSESAFEDSAGFEASGSTREPRFRGDSCCFCSIWAPSWQVWPSTRGGSPGCVPRAALSVLPGVFLAPQRRRLGLVVRSQRVPAAGALSPGCGLIPAERVPHGDGLAERGQHLVPVRRAHPAGCRPDQHMARVVTPPVLAALGHRHTQGQLLRGRGLWSPHAGSPPDTDPCVLALFKLTPCC